MAARSWLPATAAWGYERSSARHRPRVRSVPHDVAQAQDAIEPAGRLGVVDHRLKCLQVAVHVRHNEAAHTLHLGRSWRLKYNSVHAGTGTW